MVKGSDRKTTSQFHLITKTTTMQTINNCPACELEKLGTTTHQAPHTCTTGTGERKAVIQHQTYTHCPHCDADLSASEVRNNECWTCQEAIFHVKKPSETPQMLAN